MANGLKNIRFANILQTSVLDKQDRTNGLYENVIEDGNILL